MSAPCFPIFRQYFLNPSLWSKKNIDEGASKKDEVSLNMSSCKPPTGFCKPLFIPPLDVNALQRDDGPASESILKRQKFAIFEKQCSKVAEGLYVSGELVARNREILREHGITAVVNCVGAMYPEYFKNDGVKYRTMWLQDAPSEDIQCVLYDTFEFIEQGRGPVPVTLSSSTANPTPGPAPLGSSSSSKVHALFSDLQGPLATPRGSDPSRGLPADPNYQFFPAGLCNTGLLQQLQQQQMGEVPLGRTSFGAAGANAGSSNSYSSQRGSGSGKLASAAAAGLGAGQVPFLTFRQRGGQQNWMRSSGSSSSGGGGKEVEGHVLVHCSQGVSRSTTLVIAYLMWKTGKGYDEVYQAVRNLRGVTSPNIGFTCQLLQWQKRRNRPPTRVRVYRIAPHCADDPLYFVPKVVSPIKGSLYADARALDPRGCFLVHLRDKLYVWVGDKCLPGLREAGLRAALLLKKYESAPAAQLVLQGKEPEDLVAALQPPSTSASTLSLSGDISVEPSAASLGGSSAPGLQFPAVAAGGLSWPSGDLSREASLGGSSFSISRTASATTAAAGNVGGGNGGVFGLKGGSSSPFIQQQQQGLRSGLTLQGSQQGSPRHGLALPVPAAGGMGGGGGSSSRTGVVQPLNLSALHQTLAAACPPAGAAAAKASAQAGKEGSCHYLHPWNSGQMSPLQELPGPSSSESNASDVPSVGGGSAVTAGAEGVVLSESSVGTIQQQQQQQGLVGRAGSGSLSCDASAAAARMTEELSGLAVVENDDYSRDYDIVVRECLKHGLYPPAEPGPGDLILSPRSAALAAAHLSKDDLSGVRPESPATSEGRTRKVMRRSESDRGIRVIRLLGSHCGRS